MFGWLVGEALYCTLVFKVYRARLVKCVFAICNFLAFILLFFFDS